MKATYEPATWRLLLSGVGDGPNNMAVDEAILEAVAASDSPPTLRFYGCRPPCLSLGSDQAWDLVEFERCADLGWQIVRRPTPGRAVLHADELAYSLCLPAGDPRAAGDAIESCQRLAQGVQTGLARLGLEPARARPYYEDRGEVGDASFDGPSAFDISVGQRKLVANTTLHANSAILQHGFMPLGGDLGRIAEGLYFDMAGQRAALVARLGYRATTLEHMLGRSASFEEVQAALVTGFAEALNLTLLEEQSSEKEQARAAELRQVKYATDAWTKLL